MKKSMIEIAHQILSDEQHAMPFLPLWDKVAKEMGFNQSQHDDNIAQFYSDLSMDGRFTNLKGNTWDLRKRQSHANSVIDMESLSVEDEEDEPEFDEEPVEIESMDDES